MSPLEALLYTMFNVLLYALVVAVVARAVTAEEIFSEVRDWAKARKTKAGRKLFYPLTCNFCFSFWVSAFFILLTGFNLFGPRDVLSFFMTLWAVMGVSVGLQVAYEYTTVKVKERRTLIAYNQLMVEHQEREAQVHKFNHGQMLKAQKHVLEQEAAAEREAAEREAESIRQALTKPRTPSVN